MKDLTKIFTAVVAGMLAFSCVTDTTEDLGLGIQGSQTGVTEVVLSLEEARTQLGEKVDGLYPLYWSEGDKISVNGIESSEAIINSDNCAYATFAINGTPESPYAVAYPAAPQGQVLFAEKQNHVVEGDTFGNGVSTMYGYGTDLTNVKMNHLTGILKIAIKGDAVLSKAQISTADRAAIAGAFDIDFASGKLSSTAASKSVIEYSFGEAGLQLSSEEQYIHVAVPAGVYDELYVTLYEKGSAGNVMYVTVKAGDSKPLTAGRVREFKNAIIYSPRQNVYVVNDVESLKGLATAINAGSFYKDVIFTADVDMSGENWTTIGSWVSTNGDKVSTIYGNGYAIKGLNAPLFGILTAHVKGLHFENVNIASNNAKYDGRWVIGALACECKSPAAFATRFENCSVSGTIKVLNPTSNVGTAISAVCCGGLFGRVAGVVIDGCVNDATITVEQIAKTGITTEVYTNVGGIAGYCNKSSSRKSLISNCVNNGAINFNDESGIALAYPSVGGIVGMVYQQDILSEFVGNINKGTISYNSSIENVLNIGGIVGRAHTENGSAPTNEADYCFAKECKNEGTITINGSATKDAYIGGVAGYVRFRSFDDCHNNGAITLSKDSTFGALFVGGLFGVVDGDKANCNDYVITGCSNDVNGTISVEGTINKSLYIGGVVGRSNALISELTNNAAISFTGKSAVSGTADGDYNLCLGGVAAATTGASVSGLTNNGAVTWGATNTTASSAVAYLNISGVLGRSSGAVVEGLTNNGVLKLTSKTSTAGSKVFIGGAIGRSYSEFTTDAPSCKDITNNGDVTIEGTMKGQPSISGAVGHADSKDTDDSQYLVAALEDITNAGDVLAAMNYETNANIYVAGCVGRTWGSATILTNSGDVSLTGKSTKNNTNVMGCIGYGKAVSVLRNSGTVSCSSADIKTLRIAGCAGYPASTSDAQNSGTISFTGKTTGDLSISGVVQSGGAVSNCHNTGSLLINGTVGAKLFCSGVATQCSSVDNVSSICEIKCLKTPTTMSSSYIGGIVAQSTVTINDATAFCEIEAIDFTGGVGMVTGVAKSSTVIVTNSEVGGSLTLKQEKTIIEDPYGGEPVEEITKIVTSMDASNWFKYIYGAEATLEEVTEDGCSLLETKPTL